MGSLAIALLQIGSAVTLAAAGAPAATEQIRPPGNDPDQIVCVTESETGSRVRNRRVCRTRAEWEAHQLELRTSVERAQNQSQTHCVPTPTMQC